MNSETVLVTGGSGLVGKALTTVLLRANYRVKWLSRTKKDIAGVEVHTWDIENGTYEPGVLDGVTVIVHMAGEGVSNKRWNTAFKKRILDSRTQSSLLLNTMLKENNHQVHSVISASGANYYGNDCGDHLLNETSETGEGFLPEVVKQWEDAINSIKDLGIRVVNLRIGMVLSDVSGALPTLIKPIRFFVGASVGSGNQYISWIHIQDLCAIVLHFIKNREHSGPYNAVTNFPVTNKRFMKLAAVQLKKPLFLPNVPGWVLFLLVGEMAAVVLGSLRLDNTKLTDTGFSFSYGHLEKALSDLI